MRRPNFHVLSLACLVLVSSQCEKSSRTAESAGAAPLATVGDRKITAADLTQEAEWRLANHQPVPPPADLLKEMVDRLSLIERARSTGLADEPETRRRLESLLIARLREQQIDPLLAAMVVTEDEVRAAYQARADKYSIKSMDRFSILFQEAPAKSSPSRRDESRQRLASAIELLTTERVPGGRGPAANGFGAVAIDFSDDQTSRYRGGDVGWLDADAHLERLPADVLNVGRGLAKGKRSGVLETPQGFYVIMKTDSRGGGVQPYEEVEPALRHELLLEKRRAAETQFVAESVKRARATMDLEAARQVALPTTGRSSGTTDTPPPFPGISSN